MIEEYAENCPLTCTADDFVSFGIECQPCMPRETYLGPDENDLMVSVLLDLCNLGIPTLNGDKISNYHGIFHFPTMRSGITSVLSLGIESFVASVTN